MIWASDTAPASMLLGNFRVELVDGTLIVAPLENLREDSAALFSQHAREVADLIGPETRGVVVDLEYAFDGGCCDRVLGLLCLVWKRSHKHGLPVALCNLSSAMTSILSRTHLDQLWSVCDSREGALEYVSKVDG